MGKKANCQVAPSVHNVSPTGHYPLAMRLFLPDRWIEDKGRLDEAGVPEAVRQSKSKGAIALELLDTVRGEGLPGWLALADAGYGVSEESRHGLAARGLKYIVGVTDEMVVLSSPKSRHGNWRGLLRDPRGPAGDHARGPGWLSMHLDRSASGPWPPRRPCGR